MKNLQVSEKLGNYEIRPNPTSLVTYFNSPNSLVTLEMEICWLASFRESPDLELGVSCLMDELYCKVCQHVGMGIVPSCLTSAAELVQCPPCIANGEASAL